MTDQTPQGWGPPPGRPPHSGRGAPQPPSPRPKRGPGVLGWIGIGLGVLVVLGIIGSIAGGNQPTTAVQQTGSPATTSAAPVTTASPTTEAPTTAAPTTAKPRPTPTTRRPTPTTRKPTPTTRYRPPTTQAPVRNCDSAYPDACLHDGIGDYDCAGGSGNGPNYVDGPIRVRPPDPFGLDSDGDGVGCES